AGSVVARPGAALRAVARGAPHTGAAHNAEWGVPAGQRLTREEKKAQTRERLIEAGAKVFAAKGFAATSLDEVADAAGLTKGAVYSNFDNKEDLVRAVLEMNQRRMNSISDAAGDGPLEQQMAKAGQLFGDVIAEERAGFLLLIEFIAYVLRNPDLY